VRNLEENLPGERWPLLVKEYTTDEWTGQWLREATPWGKGLKYLIHDRDTKFGHTFRRQRQDQVSKK
jgi:hypothetical protein